MCVRLPKGGFTQVKKSARKQKKLYEILGSHI